MALPEATGEVEALIVPEEALVESAPMPVDAPEVGQMRGGTTEASPMDMAMAWTLEPKLLSSSTIGRSAPEGAPVMEEVPSAPVGPMLMVAMVDPSVGDGLSQSLVWLGDDPVAWGRNWLLWARWLDSSDLVFTRDDPAEVKD